MSYYTGERLQNRVKMFGLEELQERLTLISQGQAVWGSDLTLTPGDPSDLEGLRVTIYSILNDLSIKEMFQLKLRGRSLVLGEKRSKTDIGAYGPRPVSFGYGQPCQPDLPKGNEWIDPDKLFEE